MWPGTLPQQFLVDGFNENSGDYVIRSSIEHVIPKLRKTTNIAPEPFGGKMMLTLAQRAILSTFWSAYCASRFGFPEPYTGTTIAVRFLDPPEYESVSGDWYLVTLKLERVE